MSDRVLVAPPGLTRPDLFAERNIEKYVPPPIGPQSSSTYSPNLVVGGPAYFTPEGYQTPPQPQEAFMPTRTGYDPIRDQFNRPPAPMPMPAPAPVQEPAPIETGLPPGATVEPYVPAPAPAPQEDSPNFLAFQQTPQYQDFINSGGMGTMDMYTASDGTEFGTGTLGRMYDDYLASLGQEDSNTSAPTPAPEPVFTPPPTMPEPNGFFPNMNFEDLDFSNLPNFSNENIEVPSNIPSTIPKSLGGLREYNEAKSLAIKTGTPMPNIEDYDMSALGPRGPRIGNDKIRIPLPEGVNPLPGIGPFPVPGMRNPFLGGADLEDGPPQEPELVSTPDVTTMPTMFDTPTNPSRSPLSPIDFSGLPNFKIPQIRKPIVGGRPMIPSFRNFDLR